MANHRTPRGEESTYRGHGGKETPEYQGKHRMKIAGSDLPPRGKDVKVDNWNLADLPPMPKKK